jgi:hypothetical protein
MMLLARPKVLSAAPVLMLALLLLRHTDVLKGRLCSGYIAG